MLERLLLRSFFNSITVFNYCIFDIDNKVLETIGYIAGSHLAAAHKKFIAVKVKKYMALIINPNGTDLTSNLEYVKVDSIKYMNNIGAKQITKEEYNSFITFTIDDFEEVTL